MIIFAAGCIEPVSLDIEGGGSLVVEGWITDQPGPYTIKLSRSIRFNSSIPLKVYSIPEAKAKVSIADGEGNMEALTEGTGGLYRTGALKGNIGSSYQLIIETADGKKYRSKSETIKPVPVLDGLEYEYQVIESIFINANGDARVRKFEGFAIFAKTRDPGETANFYRWQTDGIFEFFSITDVSGEQQCWAPVPRLETRLELASDEHFNGQPLRQKVASVPYDRPTMYLVKVRQQSLSADAYEFLNRLSEQQTSTGTLFDPPPTPIAGNITNDSNAEELVLGYFGASAISRGSLLINRFKASNFGFPSRNIPMRPGFCRFQEPNATNIKPEGF